MKFKYVGEENNKKVTGFVEAADINTASLILIDNGINVIEIKESDFLENFVYQIKSFYHKNIAKVKLEDLIVLTRQFSSLFNAGISITKILDRLVSQNYPPKLKEALYQIRSDIEAGLSISEAFSRHKDIFSPLYINMLKVGEEGGVLDITLERLSTILESELETKNRIKTATRYPKLVVFAIVIAFSILITFVIPKFVALFEKFGTKLPLPTRILIWINYFFQNYWYLLFFAVIAIIILFKRIKKSEKGKEKIDENIFKIPIIGKLIHKIYISRISRILALLYKSGLNISKSFDIISEVTDNSIIKRELLLIKEQITRGSSIAAAFKRSKYFPDIVSDMIEVGEETGELDQMLFKVADYYDEEIDYAIKNLSQAIEPVLLLFIAGMVLLLALGVFLPMWDMIKVFR